MKRSLLVALAAAALTSLLPHQSVAAERHEHKVMPAVGGGTLTLRAVVGSIDIRTHARDEVVYHAEVKPGRAWFGGASSSVDDLVFDYQASDDDVGITMKWKDVPPPRSVNLAVRHTLLIPVRYSLDVRTSGGGIVASGVNGSVVAHTSGGSIRFGSVKGAIKVQTSGGGITIEDVKGDVQAGTSGGSIQVGEVEGRVSVSTSGGGIKLGAVTGGIKATTSGGSIAAQLAGQSEQPIELSTSGGSIKLGVPGDFKADLSATTSGGSVECEIPVQGAIRRHSIVGKVNGGGPKVSLRTSGGSIRVVR